MSDNLRTKAEHIVATEGASELVSALTLFVRICDETVADWDRDLDMRVGKMLRALSGNLPGYRQDIDDIHATIAKYKARAIVSANTPASAGKSK